MSKNSNHTHIHTHSYKDIYRMREREIILKHPHTYTQPVIIFNGNQITKKTNDNWMSMSWFDNDDKKLKWKIIDQNMTEVYPGQYHKKCERFETKK